MFFLGYFATLSLRVRVCRAQGLGFCGLRIFRVRGLRPKGGLGLRGRFRRLGGGGGGFEWVRGFGDVGFRRPRLRISV